MTDDIPSTTTEQSYRVEIQQTQTPEDPDSWRLVDAGQRTAYFPAVVAAEILLDHKAEPGEWTRVRLLTVDGDDQRLVYVTDPVYENGPQGSVTPIRPAVPPDAELAQASPEQPLPFPDAQPESWATGASSGSSEPQRSASESEPASGAVTKDKPVDSPTRVHVTVEGEGAEEIANMIHTMEGLKRAQRAIRSDDVMTEYALTMVTAVQRIQEHVHKSYPGVLWYETELGLWSMANLTAGFTSAFMNWKAHHQ